MVTPSSVVIFCVLAITFVCTASNMNSTWNSVLMTLSEAFDSLDFPSTPSFTECIETLESENNLQLADILKVCSKALIQLNIVSKDDYKNPTEKKKIIGRIGLNFLSNSIVDDITKLTETLNFTEDGFGYIRDEFFISDYNTQVEYLVQAVQPWHPTDYHTDSYNATILTMCRVYDSKTNKLLNEFVLEERQTKEEPIYLFGILKSKTESLPYYIFGKHLPMDVYYSTKLVLIHLLNGKGKLGKYEINDIDYVMIVVDDEAAVKIMPDKQQDL